ncbi:F-box/kelch-repeat protein At3g06240-like [Papaver somniferum]|uniref:F-box/kelch-repeat protein At3g06240-like n=1 Tax=Papaver somniferum TaxID=3469 RepID=UPI000E6F6885|nr:F-box/kelch-repeat protein At3g06240-like [Papaver somniferum]
MSSMILFPEDVMYEILVRLPAKSIINCRYVCKTWFSLISNPKFAEQHLEHTIHNRKTQSKFMFMIKEGTKPYYPLVSTVSYDDTLYSSSFEHNGGGVPMDLPFQDLAHSIQLLGSCNGLICVMFQTCMVDELVKVPVIWNPTTREYKILPNSQTKFTNRSSSIYSFGYDGNNDDYKLLKGEFSRDGSVTLPPTEEEVHVSEVYSLLSDSWRSIRTNMPYHILKYIPYDTVSGVVVNGLRHWLAGCRILEKELQQESIISFDFSEDKFKQMHLPKAFMKNST